MRYFICYGFTSPFWIMLVAGILQAKSLSVGMMNTIMLIAVVKATNRAATT